MRSAQSANGLRCRGCWGAGRGCRRAAWAAAGVGGAGLGGGVVRLGYTAPPTPTRNPPWRGGRCAPPCRRIRAGLRPSGSRCRGCLGAGGAVRLGLPRVLGGGCVRWGAWYGLVTPPRPPPPVILPGAAVAALRLAGAFAPGFAVPARAAAGVWGAGVRRAAWAAAGVGGAGLGVGGVVRLGYTAPPTPTRNPPWRGGRCAPPCRRIRAGLRRSGSRCRLPWGSRVLSPYGGARKKARWGSEST